MNTSNSIRPFKTTTQQKPISKNSFTRYKKGINCDQFISSKLKSNDPVKFTGIGYFVRSSKGRQDLGEFIRTCFSSTEGIVEPQKVKLPDLKEGQKVERIVLHWSATKKVTPGCLTRYHYVIDNKNNAKIYEGAYSITDNARQIDNNKYAAHIHKGNSHSVGISMVGMKGASEENFGSKDPITEEQFEKACKLMALMAIKYKIKVTPDSITTHYEYGVRKDDKNQEKIDIKHLPWKPELKPDEIGNYIRERVNSYLQEELNS